MRTLVPVSLAALLLPCAMVVWQQEAPNYDEARVPAYTLPDALTTASGVKVTSAAGWTRERRPEILESFRKNVYGRGPLGRPSGMTFETRSTDGQALGGSAVRKQVRISFSPGKAGPQLDLLIYLPSGARGPVPLFLGLNFDGNAAVNGDPGILLGEVWERDKVAGGYVKRPATDKNRGTEASRWQVPMILAAGFGVATADYEQIEPDFDNGFTIGVHTLFARPGEQRAGDAWGAIGAWAWGLSRAMDYLETDKDVDARHVAVIGHSRLGKTALWAGAQDQRLALVVSNCSGEGGAAISRRMFGENIRDLNTRFPHWFCLNYRQYNDRVPDLPVDQHMLLALIAPRPLYVASAVEDRWADPRGEFLSAVAATPVYHLFGQKGIETTQMPEIDRPLGGTVRYHVRAGKHDVTGYDWTQYLAFAREQFSKR